MNITEPQVEETQVTDFAPESQESESEKERKEGEGEGEEEEEEPEKTEKLRDRVKGEKVETVGKTEAVTPPPLSVASSDGIAVDWSVPGFTIEQVLDTDLEHLLQLDPEKLKVIFALLTEEYGEEREKPNGERSPERLDKLLLYCSALEKLVGNTDIVPHRRIYDRAFNVLREKIYRSRREIRFYKTLSALSVGLLLVIIFTGVFPGTAYSIQILPPFVTKENGMFTFNWHKRAELDEKALVVESDTLGLRTLFNENGMHVILPQYLPDRLELVFSDFQETPEYTTGTFEYRTPRGKKKQSFHASIVQFNSERELDLEFILPSEKENIKKVQVHNYEMYIFEDGKYFAVTFLDGLTSHHYRTENIEYGELMGIIYSFDLKE